TWLRLGSYNGEWMACQRNTPSGTVRGRVTHPDSGGKSMFRTRLAAGVLALAGLAWSAPVYADDTLRLTLPPKGLSAGVDAPTWPLGATTEDLAADTLEARYRGGYYGGYRGGYGGYRGYYGGYRGYYGGYRGYYGGYRGYGYGGYYRGY